MNATPRPSKEVVRQYMAKRIKDHTPPPSPEEIRRQLGTGMIEQQRIASGR